MGRRKRELKSESGLMYGCEGWCGDIEVVGNYIVRHVPYEYVGFDPERETAVKEKALNPTL